MSGPQPGYLATYNSLTDKHLVGYFNNARIRRHLQRSGLITRSGRIIPEKEYRLNALRRDHQRYVQECLARAIFHKVLDIERHHQLEIKQKLESSVRKERVQKVKMEQFRRSVEDASTMHFPHPPLAPRYHYGLHPSVAGEPAGHSQLRAPAHCDYSGGHPAQPKEPGFSRMTSWRPNTAPGNMQHPRRLQPLRSSAAGGSVPKTSSSSHKCPVLRCVEQYVTGQERSELRLLNSVKCVTGVSPYQLPAIDNYVMPVPPPRPQKRSLNAGRNGMPRGRQFHLATAPSDAEQLPTKPAGGFPRSPLRSNACLTMIFLGKSVHLSHDYADYRDEIKVYQQHCGGENLCVYRGRLMEGETFQFISKRHRGFPFSLTFFLNGIQVDRLSCCCEYKHQKRSRLGGRHGSFAILHVEGASPCYRCIIAMGLDKEPSPPKRKVKEDHEEKPVGSWGDGACSEPSKSHAEQKSRRNSVLVILPSHEATVETAEGEMETQQEHGKEELEKPADCENEDGQEDTIKNEYDEDFEADEEVNEEGQTDDQMNGMSKSSSDDKNHNLDYENESKTSSQKALRASDSEEDESDGYSNSDSEDDEQGELSRGNAAACDKVAAARKIQAFYRKYKIHQKLKSGGRPVHSLSSLSTQYSSEDESCAETMKDDVEGKEEHNGERVSDNTAHAQFGNENGENKLLRVEENQETSVLEKEGRDEAEKAKPEDMTATGDTGIFHENTAATQHQSPEVNGELDQAASVQSDTGEEDEEKSTSTRRGVGEEGVLVPLESSVTQAEDSNEEAPHSDEGGVFDGCKPAQAEMAKEAGNDHHGNSEPEPADSHVDEEEEHVTSAEHGASEAPDAASLAEGARTLDVQKAMEQVVQDGQMQGERQALEEEESVAEEGDARSKEAEEVARVGDLLPKEDTVAVLLVESLLAVRESAPEESTRAEGDPKGQETWKGAEAGAEVEPGEQEGVMEGMRSLAAWGEQEPEAMQEGGSAAQGVVEVVSEAVQEGGSAGQGAVEMGEMVSEAMQEGGSAGHDAVEGGEMVSEAMREGGSAGQGAVVGAVSEAEEAVEEASLSEAGFAGAVGPDREEAVKEAISEGGEAVEKSGALLEASGDTGMCTGEAVPGGEDFVKPNVFSQLKASGEEWMEMGKAATPEVGEALEVEGSSLLRVEDTAEESVEPGKGPLPQEATALVGAGGDPLSEGSPRLEETPAAEEEEGSAEAVLYGNPSPVSQAKTEGALEGKADGGVGGACVQVARAEPGAGEEGTGRAAGPGERADGMEGPPGCAEGTGEAQPPGHGAAEGAALSAPGPGVSAAGAAGQEGTGDGAAGAEALRSPSQQRGHPGIGTAGSKDGAEQAARGAQREQSSLHGGTAEGAAAPVPASAQSPAGAGEQGTDSPVGGSPDTPGAADAGDRSHSACEDPAVPDTAVVPPVQPQGGKESRL